ncbi:MAG TPA: N-acetyltransferase [Oceanospirillaceae bacterium]|nr:N-acetyltransferase [Oceanospirillaceae bacterium]
MPFTPQHSTTANNIRMALADDAFYRTMQGSADNNPALLNAYLDYSMQEAQQHGTLTTSTEPDQGAAIWTLPTDQEQSQLILQAKKEFLHTHMGPKSLATYLAIAEFMGLQAGHIINEEAWYLSILGINPSRQGRGLGRQLLAPTLELADQLDRICYLETFTPRNMSFYARLGFIAKHQAYEPTCQRHYWLMVRQPREN